MKKCKLKFMDIVKTPKGQIAVVEEISDKDWGGMWDIAIEYVGKMDKFGEGNAWFDVNDLVKIDNIKSIMSRIEASQEDTKYFYSNLVSLEMKELDESTSV